MSRHNAMFSLVIAALLAVALACPGRSQAASVQANPSLIEITLGYHGLPLTITGDSAPGEEVIVKVSTEAADSHLKYKGKAAGIFWMKLGTLVFKHVPSTYLLASSAPLDKVLAPAARDQHDIGYEALQKKVEIHAEKGDMPAGDWFAQYLDFKKREQIYNVSEGSVTTNPQGGYALTMNWPYQAQPGTYKVEVLTCRDGQVTGTATSEVTVKMTGIVAKISDLAFNNRATYGIIAILVALGVGFAVGNIFKKGGGAH